MKKFMLYSSGNKTSLKNVVVKSLYFNKKFVYLLCWNVSSTTGLVVCPERYKAQPVKVGRLCVLLRISNSGPNLEKVFYF